jgi:phosphoglycolate phosphatase
VRLCVFDLDHTLVRSSLDLAAMALDMRALVERALGPLPARDDRYRVFELIEHCRRTSPDLENALWDIALDHERRALADASLEPGAYDAVTGARALGLDTALWTNNAREVATAVLDRFGLTPHFDLIVTRDEMRALKPDPDGWRVIEARFSPPGGVDAGSLADQAVVVGDSWVDWLAATAAGVPFVAYQAKPADLARVTVPPRARIDDLAALPAWLARAANGHR